MLALALWLAEDAATEGKKVITAMLVVGLVFVAVIALGEATKAWRHRRRARKPRRYYRSAYRNSSMPRPSSCSQP